MSKAILVIDIDDKYNIDDLTINYLISKDDVVVEMPERTKLKPMPLKKMHQEILYANGEEYLRTNAFDEYERGWNACINKILGEEK